MKKSTNYINEIIRITYKCNWKCKFCNVIKVNNFWDHDVSEKEVVFKILSLAKKYSKDQLLNLILSFSWWEPTLHNNLIKYIKLAKTLWVWNIELQTNWTTLFKNKEYIFSLIEAWLDKIFLAQHSDNEDINKTLGCFYNTHDFKSWIQFFLENKLSKKISVQLNIVVSKINIFSIYNFIENLIQIWFISIIQNQISFWFIQPNGYAELNKNEVLLKYEENELKEIDSIVALCKRNNIFLDFHFVAPPICIVSYPEYNLEYMKLKLLEDHKQDEKVNAWNLESYKILWNEKKKYTECDTCAYNKYCLWFYKNWIDFVWESYVRKKITDFLGKEKKA